VVRHNLGQQCQGSAGIARAVPIRRGENLLYSFKAALLRGTAALHRLDGLIHPHGPGPPSSRLSRLRLSGSRSPHLGAPAGRRTRSAAPTLDTVTTHHGSHRRPVSWPTRHLQPEMHASALREILPPWCLQPERHRRREGDQPCEVRRGGTATSEMMCHSSGVVLPEPFAPIRPVRMPGPIDQENREAAFGHPATH
jgi:hypothetical protein